MDLPGLFESAWIIPKFQVFRLFVLLRFSAFAGRVPRMPYIPILFSYYAVKCYSPEKAAIEIKI